MKKYLFTVLLTLIGVLVLAAPPAFSEAERSQNGLFPDEIISADELKQISDWHQNFVLFDARDKRSFDSAHIRGALLPRTEDYYKQEELFRSGVVPAAPEPDAALKEAMQKYVHDTPIVTYCNSNCHASSTLALQLKTLGFTKVRSMEEGIQVWEKKEYPVVRPARLPS